MAGKMVNDNMLNALSLRLLIGQLKIQTLFQINNDGGMYL